MKPIEKRWLDELDNYYIKTIKLYWEQKRACAVVSDEDTTTFVKRIHKELQESLDKPSKV